MKNFNAFYDKFSELLRDLGLKNSKSKERILKILFENDEHLSAKQIQSKLPIKLSLTAIHRFLNFLCESGLALSLEEGGSKKYELNLKSHHDHLVCKKCGSVESFCDETVEQRQDEICEKIGFLLEGHAMILYGFCKKCLEK